MVPLVHIHYLRPPDREDVFRQHLVHDAEEVKVTLATDLDFDAPLTIGGRTVLETGSDAVWFIFPGKWHDVGRFHTADGVFRGWYANVLTPPVFEEPCVWRTTDLYLDVWLPASGGKPRLLDREQLEEAVAAGWVDLPTAERARDEAGKILAAHARGAWPPPVALEWTRERALAALVR